MLVGRFVTATPGDTLNFTASITFADYIGGVKVQLNSHMPQQNLKEIAFIRIELIQLSSHQELVLFYLVIRLVWEELRHLIELMFVDFSSILKMRFLGPLRMYYLNLTMKLQELIL